MFVLLLLFYSHKPTPAYAEIARALRARGHRVWVGQPSADGDFVLLDEEAERLRLPGPRRGFASRRDLAPFMRTLRTRLCTIGPDVVQVTPAPWSWRIAVGRPAHTTFLNDIRTAGAGAGFGLKSRMVDWSAWMSWRVGAHTLFDRTLFLNQAGARWLFGSAWRAQAHVVPLGVGEAFLAPCASRQPRDAGARVRFVYLGTISLDRHLGRVLDAAAALRRRTDAFSVSLVGPDDRTGGRTGVQARIDQLSLTPCVELLDPVPYARVPEFMRGFDVALNYLPATHVLRRQPSLKVLECRALGLPQISTRTDPNAEVILDGETGLLVEDDPQAYADAMWALVRDRDTLERLSARAWDLRAGTTWNEVASRYEAIYAAALSGRRSRLGSETP